MPRSFLADIYLMTVTEIKSCLRLKGVSNRWRIQMKVIKKLVARIKKVLGQEGIGWSLVLGNIWRLLGWENIVNYKINQ